MERKNESEGDDTSLQETLSIPSNLVELKDLQKSRPRQKVR